MYCNVVFKFAAHLNGKFEPKRKISKSQWKSRVFLKLNFFVRTYLLSCSSMKLTNENCGLIFTKNSKIIFIYMRKTCFHIFHKKISVESTEKNSFLLFLQCKVADEISKIFIIIQIKNKFDENSTWSLLKYNELLIWDNLRTRSKGE